MATVDVIQEFCGVDEKRAAAIVSEATADEVSRLDLAGARNRNGDVERIVSAVSKRLPTPKSKSTARRTVER